jgi:PAS domain S-box-containing protein
MKWSFERKIITTGFGIAMLTFASVNTLSYYSTSKLFSRQKDVEHSYDVLQKVRDVLTTLRDAERARRGYIITGKESYLNTYQVAIHSIDYKFEQATKATEGNSIQKLRLEIIEPLIAERLTLIKKSLYFYKKDKNEIRIQIELTDEGLRLHDEIWQVISQIEQEEKLSLQQEAASSESHFHTTTLMNFIGSCFSFTLLFVVYRFLDKQINRRQKLEETLRESEQRYRKLFDVNPHPLWVYELESLKFLAVNEVALKQYGFSSEEFLKITTKDIRPPNDVSAFINTINALPSGAKRIAIERHKTRDGKHIIVEINSHELIFQGKKARLVLARDITLEKQSQEALAASEAKFRQFAESIDEIFWMRDTNDEKVLYVNPAYERVWGMDCATLYNDPLSFLDILHPEDKLRVSANLKANAKKEYEIEYRIIRHNEGIRWVWEHNFPIKNESGYVYRRAGVIQDITERKKSEEVRRNLEKELELNELKLNLFSMISHEFRTPLSTILISAQVLENSSKEWTESKKLKNLHRIQYSAKTMSQLLTDILTLTRAEAGKLEFRANKIDLEELCYSLVEEIKFSSGTQQNIIFISNSPHLMAFVDEKILRSIITNLLTNAIKYSPTNSQIYLTLDNQDGEAIFQIQDQGIGIPLEEQEKLYTAFHRCQNVGDIEGTGLGLAVVKKCVELHNGNIKLKSKVGVGTTFIVRIPLIANSH